MLLSIIIAVLPWDSNISLCLAIESIVSLNIIIFSFGNFLVIRFTADNNLFSAQLNNSFLFRTFKNHAFAIPLTKPPFLNNSVRGSASYFLKRFDIFFILEVYVS